MFSQKKIPVEIVEVQVHAPKKGEVLVVMIPDAEQEFVTKFKEHWEKVMAEGGSKTIFVNTKLSFKLIRAETEEKKDE